MCGHGDQIRPFCQSPQSVRRDRVTDRGARGPRRLRRDKNPRFGILSRGEVSEWLMVPLSKSGVRKHRGFESRPLRHNRPPAALNADASVAASAPHSRTNRRADGSRSVASDLRGLCARSGARTAPSPRRPSRRADVMAGPICPATRCAPGGIPLPCPLGRGRLVDYGAALEMRFGATHRGFESRPLRHTRPQARTSMRALSPPVLAHVGTVGPMARGASPRTSGGCALAPVLGSAFASTPGSRGLTFQAWRRPRS
jgi:hypothetical protein